MAMRRALVEHDAKRVHDLQEIKTNPITGQAVGWECMAPLTVEAATHGAGRTGAKKGACLLAGS
jgi:hypothetical protein